MVGVHLLYRAGVQRSQKAIHVLIAALHCAVVQDALDDIALEGLARHLRKHERHTAWRRDHDSLLHAQDGRVHARGDRAEIPEERRKMVEVELVGLVRFLTRGSKDLVADLARYLGLKSQKIMSLPVELQVLTTEADAAQRAVGVVLQTLHFESVLALRYGAIPLMEEESRAETRGVRRERIPGELNQVERDVHIGGFDGQRPDRSENARVVNPPSPDGIIEGGKAQALTLGEAEHAPAEVVVLSLVRALLRFRETGANGANRVPVGRERDVPAAAEMAERLLKFGARACPRNLHAASRVANLKRSRFFQA